MGAWEAFEFCASMLSIGIVYTLDTRSSKKREKNGSLNSDSGNNLKAPSSKRSHNFDFKEETLKGGIQSAISKVGDWVEESAWPWAKRKSIEITSAFVGFFYGIWSKIGVAIIKLSFVEVLLSLILLMGAYLAIMVTVVYIRYGQQKK
jgi:hypothetical protein